MRAGLKMGDGSMVDTCVNDGLVDAFHNYHMGITGTKSIITSLTYLLSNITEYTSLFFFFVNLPAENVSKQWGISRNEQDQFALNSQLKCERGSTGGLAFPKR